MFKINISFTFFIVLISALTVSSFSIEGVGRNLRDQSSKDNNAPMVVKQATKVGEKAQQKTGKFSPKVSFDDDEVWLDDDDTMFTYTFTGIGDYSPYFVIPDSNYLKFKTTASYTFSTYFLSDDQYTCFLEQSWDIDNIVDNTVPDSTTYPSCAGITNMYQASSSCIEESTCIESLDTVTALDTYYIVIVNTNPTESQFTVSTYFMYDFNWGLVGAALFCAVFFPVICFLCCVGALIFVIMNNNKKARQNAKGTTTVVQLQNPNPRPPPGQPVYIQNQGGQPIQQAMGQPIYINASSSPMGNQGGQPQITQLN